MKIKILTLLPALTLIGCGGLNHINGNDFVERARSIEKMSSASHTTYIGTAQNIVYLQYRKTSPFSKKWLHVVFWTEIENLPEDIRTRILAGDVPWIPWEKKSAQQGAEPAAGTGRKVTP